MRECEADLKGKKAELEKAIAEDTELSQHTEALTEANTAFKSHMKHATMHLPKSSAKAKAKAKAQP